MRENTTGKGFRNVLLSYFNMYYQLTEKELGVVQDCVDILHNSSLLIDDVEDGGVQRRGKRCAHLIYGVGNTINAGNMMYFRAWERLQELDIPDLNKLFVDGMMRLHVGQGMEIYWRDHRLCPEETEYLDMVVGKTAGLFKLGVRVMDKVSEQRHRGRDLGLTGTLERYCDLLGMIYQIRNDLDDLDYHGTGVQGTEEHFAHDLTERKYSFPVVYCIQKHKLQEADIFGQSDKLQVVKRIESVGGIQYCLDKIASLQHEGSRLLSASKSMGYGDAADGVVQRLEQVLYMV